MSTRALRRTLLQRRNLKQRGCGTQMTARRRRLRLRFVTGLPRAGSIASINRGNRGSAGSRNRGNGGKVCRVYRVGAVNSQVSAQMGRDQYHDHPCQKPVKLMAELVDRLTEKGATVLDPYMGSGTTGIACIRTGRNFVGIEKDPRHYKTAVERIRNELNQGVLL